MTPVHFLTHGSTRMLEEATDAGRYWEDCGRQALEHRVKGIIIMVRYMRNRTSRILTSPGRALGMSGGQDRSCNQPIAGKKPLSLRPTGLVPKLETQPRSCDSREVYINAIERRFQRFCQFQVRLDTRHLYGAYTHVSGFRQLSSNNDHIDERKA